MTELDRMTEGTREKALVEKLRRGTTDDSDWTLPFFPKIQIQTTSFCNASCVTCPYPVTSNEQSMGRMDESLFRDIVSQMRNRNVERVSLFLMNEPLLDRRLGDFTAHVSDELPDARTTIITNGVLLDGDRAEALARAGMGEISVSVNGFDGSAYGATMKGLSFDRIVENLREVSARSRSGRLGEMEVRVVSLDIGSARDDAAAFAADVALPVYLKPVANRAGSVRLEDFCDTPTRNGPRHACQRPFVKAYVLFDGSLVLCNCDWARRVVVGSLHESTLEELWLGPVLTRIRRQHALQQIPRGSLCAACDYPVLI